MRSCPNDWDEPNGGIDVSTRPALALDSAAEEKATPVAGRKSQSGEQFPMQILVPAETRDALRQRSAETGASIRYIILRSLAADGFPVPKMTRWTK